MSRCCSFSMTVFIRASRCVFMMSIYRSLVVLLSVLCLVSTDCPAIVSRSTWDAVVPVHVQYLMRPVKIVIIQHTVSRPCSTDEDCEIIMQAIQNYHMDDRHEWDIGSSFYVGGNGKIYEGTGWLHAGTHTIGYNNISIGINFIGDYNRRHPTNAQLDAVKDLIRCGVEAGHLTQDYHVVGQRQVMPTEGPGRKLYNAIRQWPDWLEDARSINNSN